RIELARLFAEIHEDGARFEHALAIVTIDDRRDFAIRRNLEKIGGELLVLADVDRVNRIGEPHLLKRDRNLTPVGRAPGVEIDGHERVSPPDLSISRSRSAMRS